MCAQATPQTQVAVQVCFAARAHRFVGALRAVRARIACRARFVGFSVCSSHAHHHHHDGRDDSTNQQHNSVSCYCLLLGLYRLTFGTNHMSAELHPPPPPLESEQLKLALHDGMHARNGAFGIAIDPIQSIGLRRAHTHTQAYINKLLRDASAARSECIHSWPIVRR